MPKPTTIPFYPLKTLTPEEACRALLDLLWSEDRLTLHPAYFDDWITSAIDLAETDRLDQEVRS